MVKIGNLAAYRNALRSMWDGTATIVVLEGSVDETTGRTVQKEITLAENLPCRVSYRSVKSTTPQEEAALVAQSITMYIDSSVDIPEGSKIIVSQNGVTEHYSRSGKPAVYTCHQEVPLELCREWA